MAVDVYGVTAATAVHGKRSDIELADVSDAARRRRLAGGKSQLPSRAITPSPIHAGRHHSAAFPTPPSAAPTFAGPMVYYASISAYSAATARRRQMPLTCKHIHRDRCHVPYGSLAAVINSSDMTEILPRVHIYLRHCVPRETDRSVLIVIFTVRSSHTHADLFIIIIIIIMTIDDSKLHALRHLRRFQLKI